MNESKQPVVNSSAEDTVALTNGFQKNTGHIYNLPSETQSEYAACAGKMTSCFLGSIPDYACKHSKVADISVKRHFKMDCYHCGNQASRTWTWGL